jgi:solute carrier family 45 protein 1/2/4
MVRASTQLNSIIWFSLLNIAIQPLQMASRAIIIENSATSDQAVASAWASRMQSIGSVLGFLLGSIPRTEILPRGFASEFSILCVLGSVLLLISALISAFVIKADFDSVTPDPQAVRDRSTSFIKRLSAMPREIWQIFAIQFFAWLGWFPFRTYYTRYS